MKIVLSCLIVFFICTASTCKGIGDIFYRIKVYNNSSDTIQFFDSRIYPDTTLPNIKPYFGGSLPNDYGGLDSHRDWEKIFQELPKDTLSIFILSYDTANTYNWDVIRNEYKVLKRYDLSLQDLQNSNWTITYP